jgi:hypothetical protein
MQLGGGGGGKKNKTQLLVWFQIKTEQDQNPVLLH